MIEKAMYFGKKDIYQKIRDIGGQWNDGKDRPIVCLIESTEKKDLFWAIPVGNWNHRNGQAQERINKFMSYSDDDIRSCFYHVGKTTVQSIFFVSDVIPITKKYIEHDYLGFDKNIFIIKNKNIIIALEDKLKRILSFENSNKNHFRQHITDIKLSLIEELEQEDKVISLFP